MRLFILVEHPLNPAQRFITTVANVAEARERFGNGSKIWVLPQDTIVLCDTMFKPHDSWLINK